MTEKEDVGVGDIVRFINGDFPIGVVTFISKVENCYVLDKDGLQENYPMVTLAKTRKNVDVSSFLEKVKEKME